MRRILVLGTDGAANAFELMLRGARAVEIDVAAMALDAAQPIAGTVATDETLSLRVAGGFDTSVDVECGGCDVAVDGDILVLALSPGTTTITIG